MSKLSVFPGDSSTTTTARRMASWRLERPASPSPASIWLREHLNQDVIAASTGKPPLGVEVALVTADVPGLYLRAVKAGAISVSEPATKPWGQTVAYVRDNAGHLVEICTPVNI